tara:strand:+ start:80 stop:439 length:360 start_codon:yes stop_codon:yes gene_type:complete
MEHLIGQTDAMEMVEILNAEFDIVVNQNDILKEQNDILKEQLKVSESKKDKINEYYCNECGPPSCSQCSDLIYYGQAYSEFSKEVMTDIYEIEIYCMDCKGDSANLENGWTCELFEEYD